MSRIVITAFGGIRPLARLLRHPKHTTVQGWWLRDVIPAHQQAIVLEAARSSGIHLEPSDLIPGFDTSKPREVA